MIKKVKFKKEHLENMNEFFFGFSVKEKISKQQAERLEKSLHSYSFLKGNETLGCAGVVEYWPGRAEAWAVLAKDLGAEMVAIHRYVIDFLDQVNIKRIEAVIDCGFPQGERWAELLGFKIEAKEMKSYGVEGQDCMLFSRVKDD